MNERAFNLFTALISFILIILTGVLLGTMIQAENTTKNILTGMNEQARIEAVAEIVRTDALQLFNFGMRRKIEEYFTGADQYSVNKIEFTREEWAEDWHLLQNEFQKAYFGESIPGGSRQPFAEYMTDYLIALYEGFGFAFSTYEIKLEGLAGEYKENLKTAIVEMSKTTSTTQFFTVVDCDPDDPKNCIGTFYVTLAAGEIASEIYESLPRIVVRDLATGRTVKNPIIPRKNIQIYVPVRIFKVLAIARKAAQSMKTLEEEFSEYALGVCKPNKCDAVRDIKAENVADFGNNHSCPQDPRTIGSLESSAYPPVNFTVDNRPYNYDPKGGISNILDSVIKDKLCKHDFGIDKLVAQNTQQNPPLPDKDFFVEQTDPVCTQVNKDNISTETTPWETANLSLKGSLVSNSPQPIKAICVTPSRVEVTFDIVETNPKYMVTNKEFDKRFQVTITMPIRASNNLENALSSPWSCESFWDITTGSCIIQS